MQDAGDAVSVVTVGIVTLLPFSREITVPSGLLLLNASLYRQGGVTQLQAVLMRGDACESSGPPGLIKTKQRWECWILSDAITIIVSATNLNSPRLLTTFSSGQKEALFSSTTISTLRDVLPRPVETTHSHSPLASTWTLNRISSLDGV